MQEAVLVLADGSVFKGISLGATGLACGELVFNTSRAGYQEIITDPSYNGQIITFTYPHIGNTGINSLDNESSTVHCAGIVIRDLPNLHSSFRAEKSLSEFLLEKNIVAIAEVDTRELTRRLRTHGSQNACLMAGNIDIDKALNLAKNYQPETQLALKNARTHIDNYSGESYYDLASNSYKKGAEKGEIKLLAYDFGIKNSVLRMLAALGFSITILPPNTAAADAIALNPDAIFLSNGAGNPQELSEQIEIIKALIAKKIPIFAHSLGAQLLALALGGEVKKLKFGHHGSNHPVLDLNTQKFMITSQNSSYAIKTLPSDLKLTYKSLFDNSIMGFKGVNQPIFAFQGEPHLDDAKIIFNDFIKASRG